MKEKPNRKDNTTIGMSEWLGVLSQVASEKTVIPPGYLSTVQLSEMMKLSVTQTRVRMRALKSKGLLDSIQAWRPDSVGRLIQVTYYRPKKVASEGKARLTGSAPRRNLKK
jgi:hypothetical protein